jgi:peptidoglycan hydrolase-like protein with peptidoglycan-binding domain
LVTAVVIVVVVVVVCGALAAAAVLAWPHARLGTSDDALARVVLPGYAGRVTAVAARSAVEGQVPVDLRQGKLWPRGRLAVGERVTVELTVRRPGWVGWLVGHVQRRSFTVETPSTHLLGRWLQVQAGAPVTVAFDAPVALVSLAGAPARSLPAPRAVVPVGLVARGPHSAGAIEIAAAARSWERLPAPVQVIWFPARPYAQMLAQPRPTAPLAPAQQLTLTFSSPISDVLGTARPRLSPATPGRWRALDAHTLAFQPSGYGFGLGQTVRLVLPSAVHLAWQGGAGLTHTLVWRVPQGSTLRLQQLFAQLGYLPLAWQPTGARVPASTGAQLAAAVAPPAGRFTWRYQNTPAELRELWSVGRPNDIIRGAVMMFESTHGLAVDGFTGPQVWQALIGDVVAGKVRTSGYSYVYVHRTLPQSLNLWHNGRLILSSPGNTGVPAAPTQLGTFPVFEHLASGTMSGTNPGGSHYNDPGIRYISYFNGGDAIHAFNRASFGTPQSLGCVELPLASAAKVWPYTPIGTLVTIEG